MRTFIFAWVHNAGRSQISAALFNRLVDPKLARAISAGTHPADQVHLVVVEAMRGVGMDSAPQTPKSSQRNWHKMPKC
jgi:arsenate reductase